MKLVFPQFSEDMGDAFNNAIACGVMQRDPHDPKTFFGRFELLVSDVEDGAVVADWFFHERSDQHLRVPRKGDLK